MKAIISLVIPAYNEEKYIVPTLESINKAIKKFKEKYYKNIEVIVVDNDSNDKTAEIASSYGCKVVKFKKHNIAAVRNAGAKHAIGKYIAFVDADRSIIHENTFNDIYEKLQNPKIYGGGSKLIPDKFNSFFGFFGFGVIDFLLYHIRIIFNGIGTGLIYLRKNDFDKLGGFDESYWALEDYDFVLRMKECSKQKKQKTKQLKKPIIVCSRKNCKINLKNMFSLYIKLIKKDGCKDKDKVSGYLYDVENLR